MRSLNCSLTTCLGQSSAHEHLACLPPSKLQDAPSGVCSKQGSYVPVRSHIPDCMQTVLALSMRVGVTLRLPFLTPHDQVSIMPINGAALRTRRCSATPRWFPIRWWTRAPSRTLRWMWRVRKRYAHYPLESSAAISSGITAWCLQTTSVAGFAHPLHALLTGERA